MRHRFNMRAGVVALLICCAPAAIAAQVPVDSARLEGQVRSVLNGVPLAGVLVALPGLQKFIVTDSTGKFAFTTPPGTHHLRVRYQEHTNEDYDLILRAGQHTRLEILLDVDAVHLAPVVVEARGLRDQAGIAGFYERRHWGFGRFISGDELKDQRGESVADYLARYGLSYGCVGQECGPLRYTVGAPCVVPVMLDGFPDAGRELPMLQVTRVGGIEIYRDATDIPQPFVMAMGVAPSGANVQACGAVVIWTKYWERNETDSTTR